MSSFAGVAVIAARVGVLAAAAAGIIAGVAFGKGCVTVIAGNAPVGAAAVA